MSTDITDIESEEVTEDYYKDEDDEDEEENNITDLFDVVISNPSPADKRAHHNALERKRRDHIKESFTTLQTCVPNINNAKASRAQILKKATAYIVMMKSKNNKHQGDIEGMRHQNKSMEQQVAALERIKATSAFAASKAAINAPLHLEDSAIIEEVIDGNTSNSQTEAEEVEDSEPAKKRLRSST